MTQRSISELEKVEPRESLYSIDELIDLCSRKDIDRNGSMNSDLIEISLYFANEIKRFQETITILRASIESGLTPDEVKGVFLALEQMRAKGNATTEELRRKGI